MTGKRKRRAGNKKTLDIEDMEEPFCGIRRKSLVRLSDAHLAIAAQWYYPKNCGWGPDDLSRGSSVKVWWQCPDCSKTYKMRVCSRTGESRSGCPYCAHRRVCHDNSLAASFPDKASEWHPTKNGKLTPSDVFSHSEKRPWWRCNTCQHEWRMQVKSRIKHDLKCPECLKAEMQQAIDYSVRDESGRIVLGPDSKKGNRMYYDYRKRNYDSLARTHPKIARQWHPSKNGPFKASDFAPRSDVVAWWKCNKGPDHEWQTPIAWRTESQRAGCPFCSHVRPSVTNSLKAENPELAKEWHPTRNKLKADEVIAASTKKHWWRCHKDNRHEWQASIIHRRWGNGCPYCGRRLVSDLNRLTITHPEIAAQFHPTKNGSLKASEISYASTKKVWWKCPVAPDHEWLAKPCYRVFDVRGCPACAGRQISTSNSLASKFPRLAKQWDKKKNGKLRPRDVHLGTKKSVWWLCERGHSWRQPVYARTRHNITSCSRCTKGLPINTRKKVAHKRTSA